MFLEVNVISYKFHTELLFTNVVLLPAEQKTGSLY